MGPRSSPFGSRAPDLESEKYRPEDDVADGLYGAEGEDEAGDLDLPDTGSLIDISIRRKNAIAKPAVQPSRPASGIVRSERIAPRTIAEYWERQRKGRNWPRRDDIDAKQIGLYWPNTVLMRVGRNGDPWRFESLISGIMRGGGQSFHNGEIEFNSMVMEWILATGRTAERTGRPFEDIDSFPTAAGEVRYRAMVVPLGDDDSAVTHVLCHVTKG